MKKNLLKLMALAFAVSLSLCFAGCNSKTVADTSSTSETSETMTETFETQESEGQESESEESKRQNSEDKNLPNTETSETAAEESKTQESESQESRTQETEIQDADKTGASKLEQWLADHDEQQYEVQTDWYTIELLSENDNTLVYRFVLYDITDRQFLTIALEDVLMELESSTLSALDSLRTDLEMDNLALRIEFVDSAGTVIASKKYE